MLLVLGLWLCGGCVDATSGDAGPGNDEPAPALSEQPEDVPAAAPPADLPDLEQQQRSQEAARRDPFEAESRPEGAPLHGSGQETAEIRRQACRDAGGEWGRFPNTCVDSCACKERGGGWGDAISSGCDCPVRQCFDLGAGFCRDIACPVDREYDFESDRCKLCDPDCHHLRLTPEH